jgi:DNA polymerase-4
MRPAPTLCRDCCTLTTAAEEACPNCGSGWLVQHGELADLCIAHIDCDAFYASVEKRDRPKLKDQPVIVGGLGGRGVVTTACYVARRFGVRSAMPMFKARLLCPEAVVIPPDMGKYKRVSSAIREIMRAATSVIEPVSLDEAYLDLSLEHRTAPDTPAEALARIARDVEIEVGITVSVGLAPNKLLAKLASEQAKPRGFSVIGRAQAVRFLASLPVGKINGVGPATARRLEAGGIVTVGDLQRLTESELVVRFGRFGRTLARYAVGEDAREVTPDRQTKSISAEDTFARDTAKAEDLIAEAGRLGERVARQLQRHQLAAGTVTVKLKTARFKLITRSRKLPVPTQKASRLLAAARPLIEREADGRLFRLIGIGADALVPAAEADPPDLFDDAARTEHEREMDG